jgi:hypothetical protein
MQIHQIEERSRLHRDKSRDAIALATEGRWEEAVEANRRFLASFPDDMEALNRLGKALSELGHYSEARSAFQGTLERSPSNIIARKNLERLAGLKDAPGSKPLERRTPQLFIEERGKSCTTALRNPAPTGALPRVAAGDSAGLEVDGATIRVTARGGALLGTLDPKLAARLIKLMAGGNRYAAVVASATEREVSVLLRETYQHPSMASVVSFPSNTGDLMSYPTISDEDLEEDEEVDPALLQEWGGTGAEPAAGGAKVRAPKAALAEDADDEQQDP